MIRLTTPVVAVAILAAACGDAAGPDDRTSSSIRVTAVTMGESIDPDGYSVTVGARTLDIGINGSVVFEDVEAGLHQVSISGVAANCQVADAAVVEVTVGTTQESAAFVIECRLDMTGSALAPVTCTGVAPATTSGMPLDHVELGTLPSMLEVPVLARVVASDGSQATLAFVDDSAGARFVVPLHPGGSADGGEVLIRISDEVRTCEPFAFTIEPLPQAPGEFAAIVDLMQSAIAQQAMLAGTTVDVLRTTQVTSLPVPLWPMAIAQSVLDHPANANSLRAIAEGGAPYAAGIETDVLDRLLARTRLRAGLESSLAAGSPGPTPAAAPTTATAGASSAAASMWSSPTLDGASSSASLDAVACASSPITLPAELDTCMGLAAEAAFRMDGVSNKVLNDLGAALGVAGLIPNPGTKLASAAAGLAMWTFQKMREGTANLLPSRFVNITVEPSPDQFEEDLEGPGDWMAEVTAASKGWKLDQLALETLFQIAGAKDAHSAWMQRFIPPSLQDDIRGLITNTFVQEMINTTGGSGFVQADAKTFGPVDISDVQWSEADIAQGTSIMLTTHYEYDPRDTGISQLQVRTRSGRFGGKQIQAEPEPIEVLPIDLDYSYQGTKIETLVVDSALKTYTLKVLVENSRYPEQLTLDPPTIGTATISYDGATAGTHTVTYTTPADLSSLPALLTVRHIATTGARQYSSVPRVATLEIAEGSVTISPGSLCMNPGAAQTFTATVVGPADSTVTWSAALGSITAAGVYTAPANAAAGTMDTIRAVSVANPSLEGEAIVQIGPCMCAFNATLSGGVGGSADGPAEFSIAADGTLTIKLHGWLLDDSKLVTSGDPIDVNVSTGPAWPAVPGTYTIHGAGFAHMGTYQSGLYDPANDFTCPTCGGSLTIESATDELITGIFSVTMMTPEESGWELGPTTAYARFRAAVRYGNDPTSPYMTCAVAWIDAASGGNNGGLE